MKRQTILLIIAVLLFIVPYVVNDYYSDKEENKTEKEYLQAILEEKEKQNELLERLLD